MNVLIDLPGSARERFRALFISPIFELPSRLFSIFVALVILSISQSGLVLLIGPFFKSLFNGSSPDNIFYLSELLPEGLQVFFPGLSGYTVSRQTLTMGVPLAMLVAGLAKGIGTYLFQYNQQAVALYVSKRFRDRLFSAILSLPYSRISKRSPGDWMSLVMNDVLYLQTRFSEILSSVVKDSVLILSAFLVMLLLHWPTALLVMFLSPFILFYLGNKGKKISGYADAWQRRLADMTARILSLRLRFNFIRSQQGEKRELELFDKLNDDYYQMIRKSILLRSAIGPGLEVCGFLAFALVLYSMAYGWWHHDFGPAELIQFFGALGLLLKPLKVLGEQFARIQETVGALREGMSVFAQAQREGQVAINRESLPLIGDVFINRIEAGYEGKVCFAAAQLQLKIGKSIAVVGPSGSGKSTLIKTLVGLLEPITWQANEPCEVLAKQCAFVSQRPFFFTDSLRNNLCYGLSQEIEEKVLLSHIAELNLSDLVDSLERGLDTPIESVRSNVSGGQLQRLVLIRAILRNQPFLVLDEATSAVDAQNEEIITRLCLSKVKENNCGLIFITHRLRWLSEFDEVWFVENGSICLKGSHSELLAHARYKEFTQLAMD